MPTVRSKPERNAFPLESGKQGCVTAAPATAGATDPGDVSSLSKGMS